MGRPTTTIKERGGVTHWMSPLREYVEGDWAPIACSRSEGIVAPGAPSKTGVVNCPDCLALHPTRTENVEEPK